MKGRMIALLGAGLLLGGVLCAQEKDRHQISFAEAIAVPADNLSDLDEVPTGVGMTKERSRI